MTKKTIRLPDDNGALAAYSLSGYTLPSAKIGNDSSRVVFAACHVVADPYTANDPSGLATVDWTSTMAYRHHLAQHGLGIAEAMDTAQRGMGLDWTGAFELIKRTRQELPDALVFNGCGTDQLNVNDVSSLDDVRRAYLQQVEAIQKIGGRLILMASRALARIARSPDDYITVYNDVLSNCERPVILHWLGDMFDPELAGYWGADEFEQAMSTCLSVIENNASRIDGIKISLLDKHKEVQLRRALPPGVKIYTGDDFNYPELMQGDEHGFSHALLGIFDAIAPAAALGVSRLDVGDTSGFRSALDPTVPLARLMFRAPTQYYKTGVVFLAWLNGHQDHFVMLNGAQSMRPLPYFTDVFRHADHCGLLRDPDLAVDRMRRLLAMYGIS